MVYNTSKEKPKHVIPHTQRQDNHALDVCCVYELDSLFRWTDDKNYNSHFTGFFLGFLIDFWANCWIKEAWYISGRCSSCHVPSCKSVLIRAWIIWVISFFHRLISVLTSLENSLLLYNDLDICWSYSSASGKSLRIVSVNSFSSVACSLL